MHEGERGEDSKKGDEKKRGRAIRKLGREGKVNLSKNRKEGKRRETLIRRRPPQRKVNFL